MTAPSRPLRSAEEIALRAGAAPTALRLPDRATVFADRERRLRRLADGHAMADYLLFAAAVVAEQHALLMADPDVALPDAAAVDAAARAGLPLLPAADGPQDPAWRAGARHLVERLWERPEARPARPVLAAWRAAADAEFGRVADDVLASAVRPADLAAAPLVGAALQVHWTQRVLRTQQHHRAGRIAPFGRIDDPTRCPCCGSGPTASITRIGGDETGLRYLHCSLCSAQWHYVRIQCAHCRGNQHIGYQALQALDVPAAAPADAGRGAAVRAETCADCGRYLKIVHMERDAGVEPVADDLATVALDLLLAEEGRRRHGVNALLLFTPQPAPADA